MSADTENTVRDELAAEHRDYSPGVNETAFGYVNPASVPEPTYQDEQEMLAARGVVDEQPSGEPSESWTREQLDQAARDAGVDEPEQLANKGDVLDAIRKASS